MLVAATLASPAAAMDGLWDFFESRCLTPYEHIALPDLRGLTEVEDSLTWANAANRPDGWSIWREAETGFEIIVTPSMCGVFGAVDPSEGAAWVEQVLADGSYINVTEPDEGAPHVLQSTTWREPRIEVEYHWFRQASLFVRETDLEA